MKKKQRKLYHVFILMLLISLIIPANVQAAKKYSDGYLEYELEDYSIVITKYTGTEAEVSLPAIIAGYPVSKIAAGAFTSSLITKKINLPDTIMEIENEAIAQGIEVVYNSNITQNNKQEVHAEAEEIGAPIKEAEPKVVDAIEAAVDDKTKELEGIKSYDGSKTVSVNSDKQLISVDKSGKTTVIDKNEKYELKKDNTKKKVEITDSHGNKVTVDKDDNVVVDGKVKAALKDDYSTDKKSTVIKDVVKNNTEATDTSKSNGIWSIIGIVLISCIVIGGCGLVYYKKVYQKKAVSVN